MGVGYPYQKPEKNMSYSAGNSPEGHKEIHDTRTGSKARDPRTDAWVSRDGAIAKVSNLRSISSQVLAVALEKEGFLGKHGLSTPDARPNWYLALLEVEPVAPENTPRSESVGSLVLSDEIAEGIRDQLLRGCTIQACIAAFREFRDPTWVRLFWPGESFEPAPVLARKRLQQAGRFASRVESRLLEKLVGQSEAVEALARLAFRLGLRTDNAGPPPLALFLGPPGVGKSFAATLFAEALAECREDDTPSLIRIEMTQHVQWSSGVDIFGTGSKAGSVSDRIERRPRSVVLVEEFEKGSGKALESFLPVLDTGRLERESGRFVDFQQSVFIFTSNLGSELWSNSSATEGSAFTVDLCDLIGLHGTGDDRSDWYKTAIPRELISRLANGSIVLFHEHQGHHHLNLVERVADLGKV
jgi:hypothetical protein